jgi:segregation and condensation protein A
MEIEREEKTMSQMLDELTQKLNEADEFNVNTYLGGLHTRRELVLAFMAVLELVRMQISRLFQEKVFGDIILRKV